MIPSTPRTQTEERLSFQGEASTGMRLSTLYGSGAMCSDTPVDKARVRHSAA